MYGISTLKFVSTQTVNFGIGSAFSKGPGSAFSEVSRLDPGMSYLAAEMFWNQHPQIWQRLIFNLYCELWYRVLFL